MFVFLRTAATVLKVKRLLFPKSTEFVTSNRFSRPRHFVTFNWKIGKNRSIYRLITSMLILSGICVHSFFKEDDIEKSIEKVVKDMTRRVGPSMAFLRIKNDRGSFEFLGAGFIANSNGLVITGGDICKRMKRGMKLDVMLHDKSFHEGIVEEVDLSRELVKIQLNKTDLPVMKFARSMPWIGEIVFFQLAVEVKGKNHIIPYYGFVGGTDYMDSYYTTIVASKFLTSRFIGGPVINLNGELIGIVRSVQEPNLYHVSPLSWIKDFFKE